MRTKFKTFFPEEEGSVIYGATSRLNKWLEQTPGIEIIAWHTTAVGTNHDLAITVQYREI